MRESNCGCVVYFVLERGKKNVKEIYRREKIVEVPFKVKANAIGSNPTPFAITNACH